MNNTLYGETIMERIKSFCVDHRVLKQGIYLSRVDDDITTFDIRMTTPNVDKALEPKAAHAIEHIGATLLRNGQYKDHIIYFGPMGCMTGFYLISKDLDLDKINEIVTDLFTQVAKWTGPIPGAVPEECGNYTYMDLEKAKKSAKKVPNFS